MYFVFLLVLLGVIIGGAIGISKIPALPETIKKALGQATRVTIANYPSGRTHRIVGRVSLADELLEAPLSGRRCVVYEIVVEQEPNDQSDRWQHWTYRVDHCSFVVSDSTGRAYVDSTGAQVAISHDERECSETFERLNPREKKFFATLDPRPKDGARLRYRERALEPGDEVAVLGYGAHASGPEETTLKIRSTGNVLVHICNDTSLLS